MGRTVRHGVDRFIIVLVCSIHSLIFKIGNEPHIVQVDRTFNNAAGDK